MPSFPTSVFAPTTKAAAQVIQPAHVNDLQDEVVAIETGYINGTAPLNSSNSTVANLSVTGGSTLAGGLSVASTASFASSVTFNGAVTFNGQITYASAVRPTVPVVMLTFGSTTNLVANTWTGLNWDTQVVANTAGMHSTSANSSRITFADSTGVYLVQANIPFSTSISAYTARLMFNDASAVNFVTIHAQNLVMGIPLSALVRAASTADFVTVQVNGVSSGSVLAHSTFNSRSFHVSFVSK